MNHSKKRLRPETEDETPSPQMVVCTYCDYRGTETEFLQDDPADTRCPKCWADECEYEM